MQLGLRAILLVVAIILFIVAAISKGNNAFNFEMFGLVCIAGALLVEELGVGGGRISAGGRRNPGN
jgi:hypothetical protein